MALHISKTIADSHILFLLEGEIRTTSDIEVLATEISHYLENEAQNIILDLSGLIFMNSDGLNFMLRTLTALRTKNGELYLTNPPEKFTNLMLITKLNSIFAIYHSSEDAIDHIERSEPEAEDTHEEE